MSDAPMDRDRLFDALRWLVDGTPHQPEKEVVATLSARLGSASREEPSAYSAAALRRDLVAPLQTVADVYGDNAESVVQFGRLLLHLDDERRSHANWQQAATRAHQLAFGRNPTWESICRNLRRSSRASGAAKLLDDLARHCRNSILRRGIAAAGCMAGRSGHQGSPVRPALPLSPPTTGLPFRLASTDTSAIWTVSASRSRR